MAALIPNSSFTFMSPIGNWCCRFSDSYLIEICPITSDIEIAPSHSYHDPWYQLLLDFFNSKGKIVATFTLPKGTTFQQGVWNALCQIPAGTTQTYQQLALTLDTHPRAVGQACRVNPYPPLIPCHRLVSKRGLGGYMGPSEACLTIKQALLNFEKSPT